MSLVDPLHVAIALGPVAAYCVVIGLINLSRRPLVTSGTRDAAAVGVAISGLVVAGPMELFLAEEAAVLYGSLVWAVMLVAYALLVVLVILMLRPRLVIYNMTLDQLRPLLVDVVSRLDNEARWAGDSVAMPQLGVQLHLEFARLLQNVQLVSAGPDQNLHGWKRLERELAAALRKARNRRHVFGVLAMSAGICLAVGISFVLARNPGSVMQALNEMLRR